MSAYIAGALGILILLFGAFRLLQDYVAGGTNNPPQGRVSTTTAAMYNRTDSPVIIGPTTNTTVAAIVLALPGASKFQALFKESGLGSSTALKGNGPFTILVPTDNAFGALPKDMLNHLTPAEMLRLAQYHIIKSKLFNIRIATSTTLKALSGDPLAVMIGQSGELQVNNASAIESFAGKNGVVYTVDAVLLPPAKQ